MKTLFEYECDVVRCIDGDSLVLNIDLGFKTWVHKATCRMAGINAPEMATPQGYPARQALVDMIAGHTGKFRIISHGLDKWGRWLVTIFAGSGVSLNDMMIQKGHAVEMK